MIRTLQALRAILHNAMKLKLNAYALQTSMADAGIIVPFLDMMASNNEQVVQETLAVFVKILEGGNAAAQAAFLEHCLNTREEQFFISVRILLRKSRERLTAYRQISERQKVYNTQHCEQLIPRTGSSGSSRRNAVHPVKETSFGAQPTRVPTTGSATSFDDAAHVEQVETFGNCELLLRCCQLLCEGHNVVIQAYFREQDDNVQSVDVVAEIAELFIELASDESETLLPILRQCLITLIELTTGNHENQQVALHAGVIDSVNRILRTDPLLRDGEPGMVASLYNGCAELIQGLVEDNTETIIATASDLAESLDIAAYFERLQYFATTQDDVSDGKRENGWPIGDAGEIITAKDVGYAMYKAISMLEDHTKQSYASKSKFTGQEEGVILPAFVPYKQGSITIEVMRLGRIQKLHFPKSASLLTDEKKVDMIRSVNRDSHNDKLRDFVYRSKVMVADVMYLSSLSRKNVLIRLILQYEQHYSKTVRPQWRFVWSSQPVGVLIRRANLNASTTIISSPMCINTVHNCTVLTPTRMHTVGVASLLASRLNFP